MHSYRSRAFLRQPAPLSRALLLALVWVVWPAAFWTLVILWACGSLGALIVGAWRLVVAL